MLSFNGDTSCSSCHIDKFSSTDGIPNAVGVGGHGEGITRLMSDGDIVPRNTLPLWGRGSKEFKNFFWDGKVDFINGKIISQFHDDTPSNDLLVIAAHLPFVEIREMVIDDDLVRENYKNESISSAKEIQNILFKRVCEDKKISILIESSYGQKCNNLNFGIIPDSIAHFIRDKFSIKSSKFSKFMENKVNLSNNEIKGGIFFFCKGNALHAIMGLIFLILNFTEFYTLKLVLVKWLWN